MFGLEPTFLLRHHTLRTDETSQVSRLLATRNGLVAVSMTVPVFAAMLSFVTFKLSGHALRPAPVFSSLATFNAMRLPLSSLPTIVAQITDGMTSLSRIADYFATDDIENETVTAADAAFAILLDDVGFTWEQHSSRANNDLATPPATKRTFSSAPVESIENKESHHTHRIRHFRLHRINLTVGRNEMITLVGTIGCGKSSLLRALVGEMRQDGGCVILGCNLAFCAQTPWLQNSTIRQNITFGKDYEFEWYTKVIHACALQTDLDTMPMGDLSVVGENGMTLSGGQKQRISLARALYLDPDAILMDDPFSAVDVDVGQNILDDAISGLLRGKCRIISTHQSYVIDRADRVVWMKDGTIHKVSPPMELYKDPLFLSLMATTSENEDCKDHVAISTQPSPDKTINQVGNILSKVSSTNQENGSRNWPSSTVTWRLYAAYAKAAGSLITVPIVVLLLVISQTMTILTGLWLAWWSSYKVSLQLTRNPHTWCPLDKLTFPQFQLNTSTYKGIYVALAVAQASLAVVFAIVLTLFGSRASKEFCDRPLSKTLGLPMSFFDTTPAGVVISCFGKDVDTMDNTLNDSLRILLTTGATVLSIFALVIAFYPYFAIGLAPLLLVVLLATRSYKAASKELKKWEALWRSAVSSRFGETVHGASTIRVYKRQRYFIESVDSSIDLMNSATFLAYGVQRWLGVRLDAIGIILLLIVGVLTIVSRSSSNPSTGGLVLSYVLTIVQTIQFSVRQYAEVDSNMVSAAHLRSFDDLPQERTRNLNQHVPEHWPSKGAIEIKDLYVRYRPDLPFVLKGLNLCIEGGERVGIVGRTGAGKTSIVAALFRLVEPEQGSISVDGVDTADVTLSRLRSCISLIPQETTVFQGTIRSNVDPRGAYDDSRIWHALQVTGVFGTNELQARNPQHLDSGIHEDGAGLSHGRRQLLGIARALIEDRQIVVCDEATSALDTETDQKIQQVLLSTFRGKTVICIAHRLRTTLQ